MHSRSRPPAHILPLPLAALVSPHVTYSSLSLPSGSHLTASALLAERAALRPRSEAPDLDVLAARASPTCSRAPPRLHYNYPHSPFPPSFGRRQQKTLTLSTSPPLLHHQPRGGAPRGTGSKERIAPTAKTSRAGKHHQHGYLSTPGSSSPPRTQPPPVAVAPLRAPVLRINGRHGHVLHRHLQVSSAPPSRFLSSQFSSWP